MRSSGFLQTATSRPKRNFSSGRVLEATVRHRPSLKLVAVAIAAIVPTLGVTQVASGADTVPSSDVSYDDVAATPDGDLVAVGFSGPGKPIAARYHSDGSRDP